MAVEQLERIPKQTINKEDHSPSINKDGHCPYPNIIGLLLKDASEYPVLEHTKVVELCKTMERATVSSLILHLLGKDEGYVFITKLSQESAEEFIEQNKLSKRIKFISLKLPKRTKDTDKNANNNPRARQTEKFVFVEEAKSPADNIEELKSFVDANKLQKWIDEGRKAKNRMINSNIRLAVSIAKKYFPRELQSEDLVQVGNLELMRAVEKFDWRNGSQFSTYATLLIKEAIERAIKNSNFVRIPENYFTLIKKIERAEIQLTQKLRRKPTDEELARKLNLSPKKIAKIKDAYRLTNRPVSIDEPVLGDENEGRPPQEFLPDPAKPTDELALNKIREERIKAILQRCLDYRERRVVELRFGLDGNTEKTLEEVGRVFGVTRERIRQIETLALIKLRQNPEFKKLAED